MLKFSVIQRLSKRLHVRCTGRLFNDAEAAYVESILMQQPAIKKAQFFTRSRDLIIQHTGDEIAVRDALVALNTLD